MEDLSLIKIEVLAEINKALIAFGMDELTELPKGRIGIPNACPIYHALPIVRFVDHYLIMFETEEDAQIFADATSCNRVMKSIVPSETLKIFIHKFDKGEYPELVV